RLGAHRRPWLFLKPSSSSRRRSLHPLPTLSRLGAGESLRDLRDRQSQELGRGLNKQIIERMSALLPPLQECRVKVRRHADRHSRDLAFCFLFFSSGHSISPLLSERT